MISIALVYDRDALPSSMVVSWHHAYEARLRFAMEVLTAEWLKARIPIDNWIVILDATHLPVIRMN